MKTITMLFAGLLLAASMSFAADVEKTDTATSDTSKNPITGTTTTTTKMKKKHHVGDDKNDSKVTKKTKKMKDGTVKTSTSVDATSTETKH